jgi:hypothetical protein
MLIFISFDSDLFEKFHRAFFDILSNIEKFFDDMNVLLATTHGEFTETIESDESIHGDTITYT